MTPPTTNSPPPISGADLIAAGWLPGPSFRPMLERAAALRAKGIADPAYIVKHLRREFPPPPPPEVMRAEPAPLAEAIRADSDEAAASLAASRSRMRELLRAPVLRRGALMPDACPAGAAPACIPVGGAIEAAGAILPGAHSADVCCSMFASFYPSAAPIAAEMDALQASTRFGMGGRAPADWVAHPVLDEHVWDNPFLRGLQPAARAHMADQGDGNHFGYIGEVEFGAAEADALRSAGYESLAAALGPGGADAGDASREALRAGAPAGAPPPARARRWRVLVTHHGSRGLGAKLYRRGMGAALKRAARHARGIPKEAAWLDASEDSGAAYWEALQYVGRWTRANHESIHARFLSGIGASAAAAFGNEHNFVWRRGDGVFLHGKGATPAWRDATGRPLLGLIPLNMAAPILLVLGADNERFLSFAPHGAGRERSRTATLRPYRDADGSLDPGRIAAEIARETEGIETRWFCGAPDLSEAPGAYKDWRKIVAQIEEFDLARIVARITPLGSIMAGDAGPRPWERRREQLSPKQIRAIAHRAERRGMHQRLNPRR